MLVQRGDAVTFTQIGSSYDTKVIGCEPTLFGGVCEVAFGHQPPTWLWISSTGRILAFDFGGWIPLTNSVYFICTEDHGCAFDPAVV
jgi:hypothetical protein